MSTLHKDMSEFVGQNGAGNIEDRLKTLERPVVFSPAPSNQGREQIQEDKWPSIISAQKLVESFEAIPDQVITGVLHKGCTMMLTGGAKTNKTFCLLDMAISVAAGEDWWDIPTRKGKVLYVDLELQRAFLRSRIDKIAEEKRIGSEALSDIDLLPLRGHVTSYQKLIPRLAAEIANKDYILIIIDPIYKVMGDSDENAAGDINGMMNSLETLAQESGAAICYAHHFSKGNQAAKESIDRASGSGVFGRAADSILTLTRHAENDDTYTVESTLRNSNRMEPFCVQWRFPLMVRKENLNPLDLKRPGMKKESYTKEALLKLLGDDELSTSDWRTKAESETGMSKRTFFDKKKELLDANPPLIVQTIKGNYKRADWAEEKGNQNNESAECNECKMH